MRSKSRADAVVLHVTIGANRNASGIVDLAMAQSVARRHDLDVMGDLYG